MTFDENVRFRVIWNRIWGIIDGAISYALFQRRSYVALAVLLAMSLVLSVWQAQKAVNGT